MSVIPLAVLAAVLSGCAINIPEEWLDSTRGGQALAAAGVDSDAGETLAAHRSDYKADKSQPSRIQMDFSSGRPKIAATTVLNEAGMALQASAGCRACHPK